VWTATENCFYPQSSACLTHFTSPGLNPLEYSVIQSMLSKLLLCTLLFTSQYDFIYSFRNKLIVLFSKDTKLVKTDSMWHLWWSVLLNFLFIKKSWKKFSTKILTVFNLQMLLFFFSSNKCSLNEHMGPFSKTILKHINDRAGYLGKCWYEWQLLVVCWWILCKNASQLGIRGNCKIKNCTTDLKTEKQIDYFIKVYNYRLMLDI